MSLETRELLNSSEVREVSEYLYYNAFVVNQTNSIQALTYNDTRSMPLIDEPLRYRWKCSIQRFTISSYLVPKFIWLPNKYIVTIRYNGLNFPVSLPYIPSSDYPSVQNLVFSNYQFVDMLNSTLKTAYTAAIAVGMPATFAPFVFYNSTTEIMSLVTYTTTYTNTFTPGGPPVLFGQIFFNFALNSLLCSVFPYEIFTVNPNPLNVFIKIENLGNNTRPIGYFYIGNPPIATTILTYETQGVNSSNNSIQDINRLVIQDNSNLCVRNQAFGSSLIQGPSNQLFNILEDFVYPPTDRSLIIYNANPPRYFNITAEIPVFQIAFAVYYMTANLETFPLQIIPGSVSEFKFQFIKDYRSTTSRLLKIFLGTFLPEKEIDKKPDKKQGIGSGFRLLN